MRRSSRRLPAASTQVSVDELDGHGSLADRRSAALGRARADVARGEDAWHAGGEQAIGAGSASRQDEAVIVAGDRVVEPVGAWCRAEEEEQEGERHRLAT